MFIGRAAETVPLRQERNVNERVKAHCAPVERRIAKRRDGYKHCAPAEHCVLNAIKTDFSGKASSSFSF